MIENEEHEPPVLLVQSGETLLGRFIEAGVRPALYVDELRIA
jgi:hypothetical protein